MTSLFRYSALSFQHERAKFFDLRLRARPFFSISYNFRRYVCRICCKDHRWKQADILVSSVFPVVLETLIVSCLYLSTFYQKLTSRPTVCVRVVCNRSKLIGLPQSNFTLKGLIVFNRMRLSSGSVYIGPFSPVKWLSSRVYGR